MTLDALLLEPTTLRMCAKSSRTDQQSIDPITGFTPPPFHSHTVIYTLIVTQADGNQSSLWAFGQLITDRYQILVKVPHRCHTIIKIVINANYLPLIVAGRSEPRAVSLKSLQHYDDAFFNSRGFLKASFILTSRRFSSTYKRSSSFFKFSKKRKS